MKDRSINAQGQVHDRRFRLALEVLEDGKIGWIPISFMMTLDQIRIQLSCGAFIFSRHAFKRVIERNISEAEIRQVGESAHLIEDYPADKYSASCLLLGFTADRRPIHVQVSRADAEYVKIITIYEPDPEEWDERFVRRR